MNTTYPPRPFTQLTGPANLNNRRFYRRGVSRRPSGEVFTWADWVNDVESASKPSAPSDGWLIVPTRIWDSGLWPEGSALAGRPRGYNVDESEWVEVFCDETLALAEGLIHAE